MNDKVLITTTVSLDCDTPANQKVVHLVMGDYGTRALRLIPVSEGRLVNMAEKGFVRAKVMLECDGHEDLLIDCTMGETSATLVPTAAMVSSADEWNAQLILYKESDETLTTQPFKINVHGTVYEGDAVEHTDSRVLAAEYDEQGDLLIEILGSDEPITASGKAYLASYVEGVLSAENELVTAEDRAAINGISNYLDQSVKQETSPRFAGMQIGGTWDASTGKWTGGITIEEVDGTYVIKNARFA